MPNANAGPGGPEKTGYPNTACNGSGYLALQEEPPHRIYWEAYGAADGEPVMFLHGGPGAGCQRSFARFFDPARYRVILFDQRGCGKSTPCASDDDARPALADNTTAHLVADILRLRRELAIHGKMHVFGGSWGSTLALAYAIAHPETVETLILRGVFLCRRADVDYLLQGNAADFARDPLAMPAPGAYLDFPTAWARFLGEIPPEYRGDVVAGLARIFAEPPRDDADRDRIVRAASACLAWERSVSRLTHDENSQGQPNPKYALMAGRILIHYMSNGGFLAGGGEAGRDNNHILDHVERLAAIPMHIVHGRYDRVCHLSQAEALVRALRAVGNKAVHYFITTAGHSSLEPETDSRLCAIMDGLPPMNPFDRGGE
ncbi:MAG TPA: alpha/beta fold hydrolase [Stellaceae bacterium]|nr:alpha/beta fold hydrolase [Stellaceae bacterium]